MGITIYLHDTLEAREQSIDSPAGSYNHGEPSGFVAMPGSCTSLATDSIFQLLLNIRYRQV